MINFTQIQEEAQNQEKHHGKASSAYNSSRESTMSGFEIVVELYKGMIRNIEEAKAHYREGRLDDMCHKIEKTNKILIALQTHLDYEQGGEAASTLNNFYNQVFGFLARVHRTEDPIAEFDRIIAHIQPVYQIWCTHAQNEGK